MFGNGGGKIGNEKLERIHGDPLPQQLQTALWTLASDWAEKILCITPSNWWAEFKSTFYVFQYEGHRNARQSIIFFTSFARFYSKIWVNRLVFVEPSYLNSQNGLQYCFPLICWNKTIMHCHMQMLSQSNLCFVDRKSTWAIFHQGPKFLPKLFSE